MSQTTTPSRKSFRNIRNSAVAVLAIAGVVAAPAAANASTAPTSVSIQAQVGGFFGYVHSTKSKCETTTVTLFKANGRKIGSDLAQPNGPDGMWSINTNGHGKFFAKVGAKNGCAAATSKTVEADLG
ncbi:hypothetical protein BH10ACT11_BH10ACT11_20640 [soil metagenome]